jgi:thioredoxin-like negative regulator of GroEL
MFVAGYFARAAERYQQALAQAPDNDDAKFKRGAALVAAGQFGEAGRVLREALRERPDWPFVAHDLRALFPDEAAVTDVFEKLDRESRRANAENDVEFLLAYFLYFTGDRRSAEAIFMNLPAGGSTAHYDVFREAIARQRGGGR